MDNPDKQSTPLNPYTAPASTIRQAPLPQRYSVWRDIFHAIALAIGLGVPVFVALMAITVPWADHLAYPDQVTPPRSLTNLITGAVGLGIISALYAGIYGFAAGILRAWLRNSMWNCLWFTAIVVLIPIWLLSTISRKPPSWTWVNTGMIAMCGMLAVAVFLWRFAAQPSRQIMDGLESKAE